MYVESFEALGSTIAERYRVVSHLGAGQSGAVHLVDDTKLQRKAALKVVHHDKAANGIDNEIRNLAALSHPCLLEIYDRGVLPDGRHYFTAAYVRGAALADYLFENTLIPWSVLRNVLHGVAQGLDELHAAALVHADVKPDNILLRPTADGQLAPVIIDFAFARTPGEGTGAGAGTLGYMAPEVVQGGAPTPSSDIYALAIVCYQCLTGVNPFEGNSVSDTLHKQLNLTRPEPKDPLQENDASLPAEAAAIIAQAWSLDPTVRPKTAERLVATLMSFLDPLMLAEGSRWCPQCGSTGAATDRYCRGCGCTLLDSSCGKCGRPSRDFRHILCAHCGHWLATPPPIRSAVSTQRGYIPRARAILALNAQRGWNPKLEESFGEKVTEAGGQVVLSLGANRLAIFERTLSGPSACLRATQVATEMLQAGTDAKIELKGAIEAAPTTFGCLSGLFGRADLPDDEIWRLLYSLEDVDQASILIGKEARRIMGRYVDVTAHDDSWSLLRDVMVKPKERTPKHRKVINEWLEGREALSPHCCVLIEGEAGSGRTTLAEAAALRWQQDRGGQIVRLVISRESPADLDLTLFARALVRTLDEDTDLSGRIATKLDECGWTDEVLEASNEMLESLLIGERPPANTRGALVPLCDAMCELSDVRIVLIEAPEGIASERLETILQCLRRRDSGALVVVPEVDGVYPTNLSGLTVERLTPAPLTGDELVAWANRSLSWVNITKKHSEQLLKLSGGHARDGEHIIELLVASGAHSEADVSKALKRLSRDKLLDERLRKLGKSERMIMTVLACLGDWVRSEDISQVAPIQFDEAAFEALLVARLVTLEPTKYGVLILVRDGRFETRLKSRIPRPQRRQIHRSVLGQLDPNVATRMRGQHLAAAEQPVEAANAFFGAAKICVDVTPLAALKLMRQALDTLETISDESRDVLSETLWNSVVRTWAELLSTEGRAEALIGWLTPERTERCDPQARALLERLAAQGMLDSGRVEEAIETLSQQLVTRNTTNLSTPLDLCWLLIDQGRHREALTVAKMGWNDELGERSTMNRSRSGRQKSQSAASSKQINQGLGNSQVEAETMPVDEQVSGSTRIDTQRHAAKAMAKGLLAATNDNLEEALESLMDADDLCRVSSLWLRAIRCRMLSAELWARKGNLEKAVMSLKSGVSLGLKHGYIVEVERGLRSYLARHGKAPARIRRIHHTLAELLGERPVTPPPR